MLLLATILLSITITKAALPATSTVKTLINADYGNYLADGNGVALYMFELDEKDKSNCYDSCATAWPPLFVDADVTPTAASGVTQSMLGVSTRTDGKKMVTYNGWPLYYYVGEVDKPDIVMCQAKVGSGGLWFIMSPNGNVNTMTKGRPTNLATGNSLEIATHPTLGKYLVDKTGVSLYMFENDTFLKSVCYTTCAADWPPYTIGATEFPTFGTGLEGSLVYYSTRTDATRMVTYNGMPLYYYKGEVGKPGVLKCQNISMNGGYWWIVKPSGVINKDKLVNTSSSSSWLKVGYGFLAILTVLFS